MGDVAAYNFDATPGQVVIAGNALMEGSDYAEFKYTKKEFVSSANDFLQSWLSFN